MVDHHFLKTADHDWFRQRLNGTMYIVLAAFVLLLVRLFYLQVIEGEEYRRLSENNCIRLQSIDPPRGQILDREGRLLVDNRPAFDVAIIPRDAKPVDETLRRLVHYTGFPADDLMRRVRRARLMASYRPIVLRQDISRDSLAAIEARRFDLPGVRVAVKPRRQYVHGDSAAHLLGYMSEISADELECGRYPGCRSGDYIGKYGIEKEYETVLRGERGGRQVEVDARGQVVRQLKRVDAVPGHNVLLTIDHRLQTIAEEALGEDAGAVVAVDPANGEVLVMASRPSFDPNLFVGGLRRSDWQALVNDPRHPMENKAIRGVYPPASTYKIVTALAGLEEGVIDARTQFFCPGHLQFGNRVYRCWKKGGHGHLDVVSAIEQSCDVFFYQVGIRLGVDRLAFYARGCGLGTPTGVDLEQEEAGLIPTAQWKRNRFGIPWQRGETLSVAIGQGFNLVTPIQMAVLTAAVGNGGTLYRPQLLRAVKTAEGSSVETGAAEVLGKLPVSEATLAQVREGLYRVVQGTRGTARRIRMAGITVSGKTGTAQVFSRKGDTEREGPLPDHLKDHAWFVAYAPSEAPRIAVAVMVEHGEHGSSAAAPIAQAVIQAHLRPDAPPGTRLAMVVPEDLAADEE